MNRSNSNYHNSNRNRNRNRNDDMSTLIETNRQLVEQVGNLVETNRELLNLYIRTCSNLQGYTAHNYSYAYTNPATVSPLQPQTQNHSANANANAHPRIRGRNANANYYDPSSVYYYTSAPIPTQEQPTETHAIPRRGLNANAPDFITQTLRSFLEPVNICPTAAQIENATRRARYGDIVNPLNLTCPINLDTFSETDMVTVIRYCGHIFNTNALNTWFLTNCRCPVCRYDIRNYNSAINGSTRTTTTTTTRTNIGANIDVDNVLDENIDDLLNEVMNTNTDLSGNSTSSPIAMFRLMYHRNL
jgi:hypothetical protein